MTSKMTIENISWTVEKLYSKLSTIGKPKFNRDMKWTVQPTPNGTKPCFKNYIKFLLKTRNSVFPVSLGTIIKNSEEFYIVIDGNNRINAIITFMKIPYKIFPEYYEEIEIIINNSELLKDANHKKICVDLIKNADYKMISRFRRLNDILKTDFEIPSSLHKKIEDELIKIQEKFLFNGNLPFDLNIHVSINIFKNGTIAEYNETYDDINRYKNELSYNELLASSLYNTCLNIKNNEIEYNIRNEIKEFYNNRGKNEVLEQYKIEDINTIDLNAFDFMVGLQNYFKKKYKVIPEFDPEGLSPFFKLFGYLYGSHDSNRFTDENINEFIEKLDYGCDVLNKSFEKIFPSNINETLFNKRHQNHKGFFSLNPLIIIILSNIINMNKTSKDKIIKKNIIIIIYHELCCKKNVNIDEMKLNYFKTHDLLEYKAGGKFIDNLCEKIVSKDHNYIFTRVNKSVFLELLKINIDASIKETTNISLRKKNKRRPYGFIYKILLANYWNRNMPNKFLNEKYSTEHIIPFSCSWEDNSEMDIDRIGNIFPTLHELNLKRSNGDFSVYKSDRPDFYEHVKILTQDENYYNIIKVIENKKHKIMSVEKYNKMCIKNEELYVSNLMNELFSE